MRIDDLLEDLLNEAKAVSPELKDAYWATSFDLRDRGYKESLPYEGWCCYTKYLCVDLPDGNLLNGTFVLGWKTKSSSEDLGSVINARAGELIRRFTEQLRAA